MYFYLLVMTVVFAMPMVFTLLSSVKTKLEIFSDPFALPKVPQFINYIVAWKEANMSRYFINSILQAGATVIILAIMASMAAYVLSRFDFKGNKFLLLFFTVGMMVPMHTVLVPVAYIIGALNLKKTIYWP